MRWCAVTLVPAVAAPLVVLVLVLVTALGPAAAQAPSELETNLYDNVDVNLLPQGGAGRYDFDFRAHRNP